MRWRLQVAGNAGSMPDCHGCEVRVTATARGCVVDLKSSGLDVMNHVQ